MRILIAEDDPVSRRVLESTLVKWGYEVVVTDTGAEAWAALQRDDAPSLAILDWMMPDMDGVTVCRHIREVQGRPPVYVILLTAKSRKEDIVEGLEAGADDFVAKPFDRAELRARIQVGERMVNLQTALGDRVHDLEVALSHVKQLQGMLPICCYCKKIRDDQNYWQQIESYFADHSEASFSHGICPDCFENVVKPEIEEQRRLHESEQTH